MHKIKNCSLNMGLIVRSLAAIHPSLVKENGAGIRILSRRLNLKGNNKNNVAYNKPLKLAHYP